MSSGREPLRVLLVSHGLPPHSVGGVEQHVDGLARALQDAGHHVTVYSRSDDRDHPQGVVLAENDHPYPVHKVVYRYEGLEGLDDLYRREILDRACAGFLRAQGPFDVVHVHHLTGLSTGVVGACRDQGIPVVLTLHDYWLMCPRGQMWHVDESACDRVEPQRCADCLRGGFGEWATADAVAGVHDAARATLAQAQAVVLPSARALPPFRELGIPADRVHVVENGVAVDALAAVPDLVPRPPGEPLRVGYLGTLIPSKGLHVLLAALARLPREDFALQVHGNAVPYHGDQSYLTRCFSGLQPGGDFVYGGPYRGDALPDLLADIDVLCAPALWAEAFGLTVREALAAGRPVLASRIGGLQDSFAGLGEAADPTPPGALVPPGNPEALARELAGLAADRDRVVAMGRRARAVPVRGFEPMAAELAALYRTVSALA